MTTISFLGPRGTFSEEALNRLCECQSLTIVKEAMHTIDEAIEAAMLGQVDYAFVPVENSLGGTVLTTMDYLAEHSNVEIAAEISMPIRHFLWGLPGSVSDEITTIYSHPQALRQCKAFLQPGSLWECLGIFAKRQINLVKIESRPTKGRLGEYKFFLDLQIAANGAQVVEALAELESLATSMQLMGAYETYHVE